MFYFAFLSCDWKLTGNKFYFVLFFINYPGGFTDCFQRNETMYYCIVLRSIVKLWSPFKLTIVMGWPSIIGIEGPDRGLSLRSSSSFQCFSCHSKAFLKQKLYLFWKFPTFRVFGIILWRSPKNSLVFLNSIKWIS